MKLKLLFFSASCAIAHMNLVNSLAIAVIAFPATVADTMMAYTLSSKLTSNQTFASIDLHTTIHRPVMQGDVEPGLKGWEGCICTC